MSSFPHLVPPAAPGGRFALARTSSVRSRVNSPISGGSAVISLLTMRDDKSKGGQRSLPHRQLLQQRELGNGGRHRHQQIARELPKGKVRIRLRSKVTLSPHHPPASPPPPPSRHVAQHLPNRLAHARPTPQTKRTSSDSSRVNWQSWVTFGKSIKNLRLSCAAASARASHTPSARDDHRPQARRPPPRRSRCAVRPQCAGASQCQ